MPIEIGSPHQAVTADPARSLTLLPRASSPLVSTKGKSHFLSPFWFQNRNGVVSGTAVLCPLLPFSAAILPFFCFRAPPLHKGYCHTGVAVGQVTNFFRWRRGQARSNLRSGRLPQILYAHTHSFQLRRPQAGFLREIGYFPTMCPESGIIIFSPGHHRGVRPWQGSRSATITHFRCRAR